MSDRFNQIFAVYMAEQSSKDKIMLKRIINYIDRSLVVRRFANPYNRIIHVPLCDLSRYVSFIQNYYNVDYVRSSSISKGDEHHFLHFGHKMVNDL